MISIIDLSGMTVPCLTIKQVAEYFSVSESTVRKWIKDNKLKAFRIFGKLWIEALHVKTFADERSRNRKIKITVTVSETLKNKSL
jgi:excisionase family DNA binding protein